MTEEMPTLSEKLHLKRPPGHSFQRSKKSIPKWEPLQVRICDCGYLNSPDSTNCSICGRPLTEEAWIAYENQVKKHQYIDDLLYLDRYFPELDSANEKPKSKPEKNRIIPCLWCQVPFRTVVDGNTVDYCPNCGDPVSEKTLLRRHWLLNHPKEAKLELKRKLEYLLKNKTELETKRKRKEILNQIIADPSLIDEARNEIYNLETKK